MPEITIDAASVPVGTMKAADLGREEIVVARTAEGCYAFGGVCPHEGGPLADGDFDPVIGTVICPWHFTEFNVKTGAVVAGLTDEPVPTYKAELIGNKIRVSKP